MRGEGARTDDVDRAVDVDKVDVRVVDVLSLLDVGLHLRGEVSEVVPTPGPGRRTLVGRDLPGSFWSGYLRSPTDSDVLAKGFAGRT